MLLDCLRQGWKSPFSDTQQFAMRRHIAVAKLVGYYQIHLSPKRQHRLLPLATRIGGLGFASNSQSRWHPDQWGRSSAPHTGARFPAPSPDSPAPRLAEQRFLPECNGLAPPATPAAPARDSLRREIDMETGAPPPARGPHGRASLAIRRLPADGRNPPDNRRPMRSAPPSSLRSWLHPSRVAVVSNLNAGARFRTRLTNAPRVTATPRRRSRSLSLPAVADPIGRTLSFRWAFALAGQAQKRKTHPIGEKVTLCQNPAYRLRGGFAATLRTDYGWCGGTPCAFE